jgi:hypothetical protein
MIADKTPLSRMGTRSATDQLVILLGEGLALQEALAARCSSERWYGYRFQTVPADSEGVGVVKSSQAAALVSPYELLGMTGLDLLEALIGHEFPSGFPAACYAPQFTQRDRQRARQLGSVRLLQAGEALHEAILNWLHDVLVLSRLPVDSLTNDQVCDLLWQRVAKRNLAELPDILPPESEVKPLGSSWCSVSYLNRQFKLLVKDEKIITIVGE